MAEAEKRVAIAAPTPAGKNLANEEWREYEWEADGVKKTYRIEKPKLLVVGNTTHRVLDSEGVVHCVPNVGRFGCVLRWKGPIDF